MMDRRSFFQLLAAAATAIKAKPQMPVPVKAKSLAPRPVALPAPVAPPIKSLPAKFINLTPTKVSFIDVTCSDDTYRRYEPIGIDAGSIELGFQYDAQFVDTLAREMNKHKARPYTIKLENAPIDVIDFRGIIEGISVEGDDCIVAIRIVDFGKGNQHGEEAERPIVLSAYRSIRF